METFIPASMVWHVIITKIVRYNIVMESVTKWKVGVGTMYAPLPSKPNGQIKVI